MEKIAYPKKSKFQFQKTPLYFQRTQVAKNKALMSQLADDTLPWGSKMPGGQYTFEAYFSQRIFALIENSIEVNPSGYQWLIPLQEAGVGAVQSWLTSNWNEANSFYEYMEEQLKCAASAGAGVQGAQGVPGYWYAKNKDRYVCSIAEMLYAKLIQPC